VKPGQFGELLMGQALLLSNAAQDNGEGFGDFQASILVAPRGE